MEIIGKIAGWICIAFNFTERLTGIATVILCCATIYLYFATKELVHGEIDTAKRTLRAYVSAERLEAYVDEPNNGERNYRLRVVWSNSGSTPASDLSIFMEKRVVERDKSAQSVNFSDMAKTMPGFIAPNTRSISGNILLDRAEIEAIGKGKRRAINVYWGATYKDIYGECHVTRQSWQIVELDDPEKWDSSKSIHLDATPIADDDLNYMSDECSKRK